MEPDEGATPPDICDLCGRTLAPGEGRIVLVPDSSAVHVHSAKLDGQRMVIACSIEHQREIQKQYQQRPFVDEELWNGQLLRAMQVMDKSQWPDGMTLAALAEASGLAPEQIERAVRWFAAGLRERRRDTE